MTDNDELHELIATMAHRRICKGDRKWCKEDRGDCERATDVLLPIVAKLIVGAYDKGVKDCLDAIMDDANDRQKQRLGKIYDRLQGTA